MCWRVESNCSRMYCTYCVGSDAWICSLDRILDKSLVYPVQKANPLHYEYEKRLQFVGLGFRLIPVLWMKNGPNANFGDLKLPNPIRHCSCIPLASLVCTKYVCPAIAHKLRMIPEMYWFPPYQGVLMRYSWRAVNKAWLVTSPTEGESSPAQRVQNDNTLEQLKTPIWLQEFHDSSFVGGGTD